MHDSKISDRTLTIAMALSMLIWGISWVSAKILTRYSTPVNLVAYRYLLVVISLLPLLLIMRVPIRIAAKGIPVVLISGVLLALYTWFFFEGLRNGTPGAGGVLVTTLNPVMAYVLGIALNRKMPSRREGIGLLLGIAAGIILLKAWNNLAVISERGNLLFLLAAATWSVMSKFTSSAHRYGGSFGFSLWQYLVTFLCLAPFANRAEIVHTIATADKTFWLNLFFSSVIVTTVATTIYFFTTTRLGAEKASSYIFMVPMAAATSSFLLLGEHVQWHTMAGGLLGIGAVYVINSAKTANR